MMEWYEIIAASAWILPGAILLLEELTFQWLHLNSRSLRVLVIVAFIACIPVANALFLVSRLVPYEPEG